MFSWGVRRPFPAAFLVALAIVIGGATVAACSDDDPPASGPTIAPAASETTTTTMGADGTPPPRTSYVAQVRGKVKVWKTANSSESTTLSSSDEGSQLLTFLVVDRRDDGWLEVLLPTPPAGGTGFIQEKDVFLSRHRFRIEVSRSKNEMIVYAGPLEALKTPVALGPDAPPAGTATYIKELRAPEFMNIYGSPVYGLAGAANKPEDFKAGKGVVAIHPVDVSTLGRPVPAGSIGVDPGVLARLTSGMTLPLGTPVDVVD
jgi:hypothetical protein